jgi:SSS family solute:Na+ symporter
MNMSWIDWALVAGFVGFLIYAGMTTRKLTRGVADYLAGNRCAGRYLLSVAQGQAQLGAVAVIAAFEQFYTAGFTPQFWSGMFAPIGLFVILSGWVIYRFRQTRAMTLAQFFEMRYSRKFRIYAGLLCWVSGTINFGIFPGVGARFFIKFCNLPAHFDWLGFTWATFPVLMFGLISVALFLALVGGQVAVMVTDFWQGLFAIFIFLGVLVFLSLQFSWSTICEGMIAGSAPGKSLINPMDISEQPDFNIIFFLIAVFFTVYSVMAWQGAQGYNCAATTAHEAKMANVMGQLRGAMFHLGLVLIPVVALTVMNHPDYADTAAAVTQDLKETYPDSVQHQRQMTVPVAVARYFPVGLLGGFVAAMLGFFISTHNTYMHSWGSIFIQDIVNPLRKKPMSPKGHMLALRLSVAFQAVFIFVFSLLFSIQEYLYMFFQITGAIFLGGAGITIIGGLYWKRGNATGAWAAMTLGCVLSLSTIAFQQIWPHIPEKVGHWYHLEPGQKLQLQGKIALDSEWPNRQSDTKEPAEPPAWYVVSRGLTFEMSEFETGEKSQNPLPKPVYKTLPEGEEILVSARPSRIEEILGEPDQATEYVIHALIAEVLGDSYYLITDDDGESQMVAKIAPPFPVNGQVMGFWCAILGIFTYIVVSLFSCRGKKINMDRLLHRGQYAIQEEEDFHRQRVKEEKPVSRLWRMIGVNSHEFTRVDKGLFVFTVCMSAWTFCMFYVLLYMAITGRMNDQRWLFWWGITLVITIVTAAIGCLWVSIGGIYDLRRLYDRLRTMGRNELDDGRVHGDQIHTDKGAAPVGENHA